MVDIFQNVDQLLETCSNIILSLLTASCTYSAFSIVDNNWPNDARTTLICGQKWGGTHCCKHKCTTSAVLHQLGTQNNVKGHFIICKSTGIASVCPYTKYKTREAIFIPTPLFFVTMNNLIKEKRSKICFEFLFPRPRCWMHVFKSASPNEMTRPTEKSCLLTKSSSNKKFNFFTFLEHIIINSNQVDQDGLK